MAQKLDAYFWICLLRKQALVLCDKAPHHHVYSLTVILSCSTGRYRAVLYRNLLLWVRNKDPGAWFCLPQELLPEKWMECHGLCGCANRVGNFKQITCMHTKMHSLNAESLHKKLTKFRIAFSFSVILVHFLLVLMSQDSSHMHTNTHTHTHTHTCLSVLYQLICFNEWAPFCAR